MYPKRDDFKGAKVMRVRHLGALLIALLIAAMPLSAQERFGGLTGVVTDTSKLPVPGATVTATNNQTGTVRSTVTAGDGTYRISELSPGRYTVTIELQGFQKVSVNDALVLLGKDFPVSAEMKPGAVTEVVNVTGQIEKQIDLKSVTTRAQRHRRRNSTGCRRRASFQGMALTSPGVNQGDIEGGFQVQRRQRRRELTSLSTAS